MTRLVCSGLFGLLLIACGGDDEPSGMDSGAADAARVDSGATDSGAADAARVDSGATDSGAADAARVDSGAADSGAADSGAADSGAADSGAADSGAADSGADAGTPCRSNAECGRSRYCAGTTCDGDGNCAPRPLTCPDVVSPVCGCDGRTYNNACEAASSGVRVASTSACGDTCGMRAPRLCCFDDADCADGTVCRGEVCAADGAGTCVTPPRRGSCWDETDCGRGEVCVGSSRCPCGAECLVPDRPGRCEPAD